MAFYITTDSSADYNRELLKSKNIGIVDLKFDLDGKSYSDNGESISYDDFYDRLDQGSTSKTSAVNTAEFTEFFESYLKKGQDVFYIGLSSELSSTYHNALRAKQELEEKYPDRKIYIVESKLASSSLGLILEKVVSMKNDGISLDEIYKWVEANQTRFQTWVSATDLSFLAKGGRLSAPKAFVGKMLKICPVLRVNEEGKLVIDEKIRSKKKSYQYLIDKYASTGVKDQKLVVSYSKYIEDAELFKSYLLDKYPELENLIHIDRIGSTVGSHTGPCTLIFCFETEE